MNVQEILDPNNLLFYDIEVFKEDSLVVFKDINKKIVDIYHNDFTGITETIKDKTLVGFNNYFYDDPMLEMMLVNWTPYQLKQRNDELINGNRLKTSRIGTEIISLDCFQQADVSRPSLKKIEANMGKNIYESEIDFNINRKLTENEIQETIEYCSYDVDMTIEIYKLRKKSYFEPKLMITQMLDPKIQIKAIRWNTTTISSNLVTGGKPLTKWSDIRLGDYDKDGEYEMFKIVPEDVETFWKANYHKDKGKYTHEEFGCKIEFGFGGLHGAPIHNKGKYRNVKLLDVASLYPNIAIILEVLGKHTKFYKEELVERRLEIKHKDKVLSDALKLVINSIYGLLRSDYSLLKNEMGAVSICIFGQIVLYDLCKRLSPTCEIVNINTDGVAFISKNDDYLNVWKQWEKDYGLTLELETFDTFVQKDVNNYIAIEEDGSVISKGGEVGRYTKGNVFRNNSNRIVDIAIGEYLINNKEPLDTILENLDKPELFQQILQAGNTYKGTYDDAENKYQKVNRVFPVKSNGIRLYKMYDDGRKVMFPDSPDQMLVWNYELDDFKNFKQKIDINYYYELIKKKLQRWEFN